MSPSLRSRFLPAWGSGLLVLATALTLGLTAGPAVADDAPVVDPTTPPATTPPANADPAPPAAPAPDVPLPTPPVTAGPPQVSFVERGTDLLAPKIAIVAVRRNLPAALRHGLRVTYTAAEPALLRADVLVVGDVVDRELLMSALPAAGPGDSLAKATVDRTPTGENVVRLAFNPAAKRTLRKFFKITVRLRLIASDAAGNQTVVHKRIALSVS